MRIRTIRPEFYSSESTGGLTWDARYMFIALFSYVEDNGVNMDNARLIRGAVMPFEPDSALPRIETALAELEAAGCIERYEWHGKRLLYVRNLLEYQKIARPGVCHYPTPDECDTHEKSCGMQEDSRTCMKAHEDSCNVMNIHARSRSSSRSSSSNSPLTPLESRGESKRQRTRKPKQELPSDAWLTDHLLLKLPNEADPITARRKLYRLIHDGVSQDDAARQVIAEMTT